MTREGLVVKFKYPTAYSHVYPGLDATSSSDDDDTFVPKATKEPWLFKPKAQMVIPAKEDPAHLDIEAPIEIEAAHPIITVPEAPTSENDNSLSEKVKILRSKEACLLYTSPSPRDS